MPIKDEELRKIIKILVDKDKEKRAKKKSKKRRKRASSGYVPPGGVPSTAVGDSSSMGGSGRPGSLMGGVNYWTGGGGSSGLVMGPQGPSRQEVQNMIQSNLTTTPPPLAVQSLSSLPPTLADTNIFDVPPRNIVLQEEDTNMPVQGAKWTYDQPAENDTFGNFGDGAGSEAFLDPEQMPVPTQYGEANLTAGDLTENYIPGETTAGGYITEGEDINPVKGRNYVSDLPAIPEESPSKKKRRSPEEVLADEQSKATKLLLKLQKKDDALKAKQAKIEARKSKTPPEPTTSIYKRGKSIPSESESEF